MIEGVTIEDSPPKGRRRDVAAREAAARYDLVRFVVAPDQSLAIDVEERLPGRGLWARADRASLARAAKKGAFARAAKARVATPADLPDRVATALERRASDLLGLAKRAGKAVAGFEKARAALLSGEAAVLVTAADAASDGRGKLRRMAPNLPAVDLLDKARLGAALGRDEATHVVLLRSGVSDAFLREAKRLAGLDGARIADAGAPAGDEEDTVER